MVIFGHYIILGEGSLHALRFHKEQQRITIEVAGERWQEHNLIFPNSVGNPMDPSNLRIDFNRLLREAGIPWILNTFVSMSRPR